MLHQTDRPHSVSLSSHGFRRRPLVVLFASALIFLGLGWAAVGPVHPIVAHSGPTITVVVQPDELGTLAREIPYTGPISGLRVLELSGLEVVTVTTSFGASVCSINGVGCPADNCFCSTSYWAYSYWDGSDWQGYAVGPSSSLITVSGSIEGWRWGEFGNAQKPPTAPLAALEALHWLEEQADAESGSSGSAGANVEVLLAFGANEQAELVPGAGHALLGQASQYSAVSVAAAGKLAVATAAADTCRPVTALTPAAYYSPTLASYSEQSGPLSWAILGALALSETVPASAVDALIAQADADGGWGWMGSGGVDTNASALAIQALVAAGRPISDSVIVDALARLKTSQKADGGFSYGLDADAESDSNSTAYVVQAIVAAGQDPSGPAWTQAGRTPLDFLLARQQADGALEWREGTGSNALATTQAIPALLGRAHPTAIGVDTCPVISLPLLVDHGPSGE